MKGAVMGIAQYRRQSHFYAKNKCLNKASLMFWMGNYEGCSCDSRPLRATLIMTQAAATTRSWCEEIRRTDVNSCLSRINLRPSFRNFLLFFIFFEKCHLHNLVDERIKRNQKRCEVSINCLVRGRLQEQSDNLNIFVLSTDGGREGGGRHSFSSSAPGYVYVIRPL